MRLLQDVEVQDEDANFPSFSEGLSLRLAENIIKGLLPDDFPSFSEGLSLRRWNGKGKQRAENPISLPFRRDFH